MFKMPKTPSFRLDGKRALVSGASSGIGLACALALAEYGAEVTLMSRNKEKLNEVASYIISQLFSSFFEIGYHRKLYKNLEARAHISPGGIGAFGISDDSIVSSVNIVLGTNVGLTLNYTQRVNKWFGISPYAGVSMTIPLGNTEISLNEFYEYREEEEIIHELESYYNYEIGLSFLIM